MWKPLILFWACFCSLFFSKACEGFEWETYDLDTARQSVRFSTGGVAGSDHPSFNGWLYAFAYQKSSDNALNQDGSGFYFGILQAGKLFYSVAHALDISSEDLDHFWYSLIYFQGSGYDGWYLFRSSKVDISTAPPDSLAKLTRYDFTFWDILGLSMRSEDADGSVPINPGRGLSIFEYSFSMPRTKFEVSRQSANYRDFFSKLEPKGNNRGLSPAPLLVDLSAGGGLYSCNFRLFQTAEFSSFLVEQLRRLSSSYDSDGGGRPDHEEWDGSGSSLVYYWDNPEDDFQPLPGVQQVEFIGGGSVDFEPPTFDEAPAFEFPDGFDLGPDSSDWSQKVLDASSQLRDKLEPLRGRFLPLFEDLKEVDPVHRVQFNSSNKIGFLSSIPINLDFDFSGGSLGSPVVSALSLIRSVLVVLIYAVLIWVIFCDVTKREKGADDD